MERLQEAERKKKEDKAKRRAEKERQRQAEAKKLAEKEALQQARDRKKAEEKQKRIEQAILREQQKKEGGAAGERDALVEEDINVAAAPKEDLKATKFRKDQRIQVCIPPDAAQSYHHAKFLNKAMGKVVKVEDNGQVRVRFDKSVEAVVSKKSTTEIKMENFWPAHLQHI